MPSKLLTDQGEKFENELFRELTKLCGVTKLRTTPYHPQTNGKVERMNQTIIAMLRTLPELHKSRWKDHVKKLVFAYNCTKHSTTGYSPYYIMFGRRPKLPIDIILPTDEHNTGSHKEYIQNWKKQMTQAYEMTSKHLNNRKNKDMERRDNSKRCALGLEPGDRVLIRNMSQRGGTGKLRNFWEEKVHKVIQAMDEEGIVIKVQQDDDSKAKPRILHRNMLMKCDDILDNFDWNINISAKMNTTKKEQESKDNNSKKDKSLKTEKKLRTNKDITGDQSETDSEEEFPLQFLPRQLRSMSKATNETSISIKGNHKETSQDTEQQPTIERPDRYTDEQLEAENHDKVDFTVNPPDPKAADKATPERKQDKTRIPRIKKVIKVDDILSREPRIKNVIEIKNEETKERIDQKKEKVTKETKKLKQGESKLKEYPLRSRTRIPRFKLVKGHEETPQINKDHHTPQVLQNQLTSTTKKENLNEESSQTSHISSAGIKVVNSPLVPDDLICSGYKLQMENMENVPIEDDDETMKKNRVDKMNCANELRSETSKKCDGQMYNCYDETTRNEAKIPMNQPPPRTGNIQTTPGWGPQNQQCFGYVWENPVMYPNLTPFFLGETPSLVEMYRPFWSFWPIAPLGFNWVLCPVSQISYIC